MEDEERRRERKNEGSACSSVTAPPPSSISIEALDDFFLYRNINIYTSVCLSVSKRHK